MDVDFLKELSCADAIAGDEDEVRDLLKRECGPFADEVLYDGLGSVIFHKAGPAGAPKILFMAHMDEVGFIVRSISDIGMLHLLPVGGVIAKSKDMQLVRVTTADGRKHRGILNSVRDDSGAVTESYVDLGCANEGEVRALGVSEGDRVCFDTAASTLANGVVAGKAMDDRTGCFVIAKAIAALGKDCPCDIYFAGTTSEEVGTRGGKTVTELVQPDFAVAVDTANHPELDRGFKNHRKLGEGPMIEHYDKTMSPNRRLIAGVKELLEASGIPYQKDMFGGGGTDAGTAHLVGSGRLAMILGIPLRYCHASCSFAHPDDLQNTVNVVVSICHWFSGEKLSELTAF